MLSTCFILAYAMSEECGKWWQIQHQVSKVQMPFLYKGLMWPSAKHIHSVDGKGELSWRGWKGDCASFIPRSSPKVSNWERSLFPSFSYFFITKHLLTVYLMVDTELGAGVLLTRLKCWGGGRHWLKTHTNIDIMGWKVCNAVRL